MKKFLWMLFILFVSGVLGADICVNAVEKQDMLMNVGDFRAYAYDKFLFKDVIWGMFYERGKLFVFLILILLTPIRQKVEIVLAGILSFIWGFYTMSCILALGFVGVVVGICGVLPHGLFYMGAFATLSSSRGTRRYIGGEGIGKRFLHIVLLILFFLTGCILETIVGTQFIPWIIRLSFI